MKIRTAARSDEEGWFSLRRALWPGDTASHREEIAGYFAGEGPDPGVVLLAELDGEVAGFAEVRVRPMAEGCNSRGVGYLEGWYVAPPARGRGLGRALVAAAEDWARSQGCTEFASDTESTNDGSLRAHLACGFEVVETVHLFRESL